MGSLAKMTFAQGLHRLLNKNQYSEKITEYFFENYNMLYNGPS